MHPFLENFEEIDHSYYSFMRIANQLIAKKIGVPVSKTRAELLGLLFGIIEKDYILWHTIFSDRFSFLSGP